MGQELQARGSLGELSVEGKRAEQWGKGREAVFSGCISCKLLGDQRKAGEVSAEAGWLTEAVESCMLSLTLLGL